MFSGWVLARISILVRYISLCVTLTVTVFITQVSHPKSLASYFGFQSLNQTGYGPRPLDCAFVA